ncbi:MAG: nitrate/nitrite transporter NrtS [Gallionella sp.]|nr:nitrate/nitrite transporter NrtS [Gallionella sp.]
MTRFIKTALSRHIVINAFKIAMVVGTLLNMVNQGERLLQGGTISWLHLMLNYLVPYCVASYSATKNEIELRESNDCKSGN